MGTRVAAQSTGTSVRVSPHTYKRLKELSQESGQPIVRYLDTLVQSAHEQRLWQRYAEANQRLQANPGTFAALRAETALWEAADRDDLDPDDGVPADEALEDAATW